MRNRRRFLAIAACWLILASCSGQAAGSSRAQSFTPVRSWYFAEGTTAYGFEEYVCVQNPTAEAVRVRATYMTGSASGLVQGDTFELGAFSRATIDVGSVVPQSDVSVKVESDGQVVCERAMYWGGRVEGHDSVGVPAPAARWYLAEGCTDYGFEEYLSVLNPGSKAAQVNITYNLGGGPAPRPPLTVPAHSRRTVRVNDDVPPGDVSVSLRADVPVVAERSMYAGGRRCGHASIGTSSPSPRWFLAEGSTKWGFDTYVLLQNPGKVDASASVTFLTETGPVTPPPVPVAAGTRVTVNPRTYVGEADFSTSVQANTGLICERSMYWNNGTGTAGHCTIGVKQSGYNCYLAEGTTAHGFETFVLIANPNDVENEVFLQYMTPGGVEPGFSVVIPPNARRTVDVNAVLPNTDLSIMVTGTEKITAERAMYWNARGAGHGSIGWMTD